MYLSKIEILGFKSFAHRVDLKYDSGVTAIVGPNGCGKTNIVDAIRWVLGEQRYSALRSEKMEDLIFNGTKNRKPLSMAEVSLTIENTKGILPTEYSEVTITRRVYRSGESEYLLNRVQCRLKDILDLFMDTGIGADAYSVIELKMVETILSDKTEDRRRLFEEAAGVTKYKYRRKAAYRKLESVQQDLVRVNDIVKEIQKTVNSLERQAKKAEQYNDVAQRLKTIEVDLLEREHAYLHGRLTDVEGQLGKAVDEKETIDGELARQDAVLDQLRRTLSTTEGRLIDVQREAAAQVENIHHVEERTLVAGERRSSLHAAIDRYEKEKIDVRAQQEKLGSEILVLNERKQMLSGETDVVREEHDRKKRELDAFEHLLATKKLDLQRRNDEAIALIHAIAEKKGEEERLRTRANVLHERIGRASEDNSRYAVELEQMSERVQQMTAEDKELRRRFVEAEMQLYQEESRKKQLQEEIESLQHKGVAVKMEIERKSSRVDFLRGLIEGEEGASEGAKFLLTQDKWKKKNINRVAEVISAEEKFRVAIEAALGESAHLLVVEQPEDAYAAVEDLKRSEKGKATFVVLTRIPAVRRSRRRGAGLRFVIDAVQTSPRYRGLVNFVLDDVVLADSLEEAKRVVSSWTGLTCVTLDGHVVSSTGVVRGGSLRQDEGGTLGRREQIGSLEEDLHRLQKEREALESEQSAKSGLFNDIDLKPFRDKVKAIEKEMTAIEIGIAQIEFEKKRANDATSRNDGEVRELSDEIRRVREELDVLVKGLGALEQSKLDADRELMRTSTEVESLDREWGAKRKETGDLEVRHVSLQSDLRNVDQQVVYTQTALHESAATLARLDAEVARAHEDIQKLIAEMSVYASDLTGLKEAMQGMERTKSGIDQLYSQEREKLHGVELKLKDDRILHDDAVEAVHALELKVSELRSNLDHLKERALKEFEMDLQVRKYPEDEWVDFAARREEVRQLKEKIRALGAINFAAFDEFKTESERLLFLVQQRDDLLEAERTLLNTIEEINNTAQKKFLDTFGLIRENFVKIFRELFDAGDECDLRLEEGADPLEARIEIIAKPRGKRPTSIELLSGGEKTLTAIALLFAIYLVKPSPFCILDEVDAPLDDSNIDRYTRILHKFSGNTQFIVVTHNKRTMEAANALYGVTMEEEGVSKIVTVRFTEGAKVNSAAVASGM